MGKSITEIMNEMRGISKPTTVVVAADKPLLGGTVPNMPPEMLESIKHKNDPVVQAFMKINEAKTTVPAPKSDAAREKVKLGVQTPVDLKPVTKDITPADAEPKKQPTSVVGKAVTNVQKIRKARKVNEGIVSGTLGVIAGIGAGLASTVAGGRNPIRTGWRTGKRVNYALSRKKSETYTSGKEKPDKAMDYFKTALGYHNMGMDARERNKSVDGNNQAEIYKNLSTSKEYFKKRDAFLNRYVTHELESGRSDSKTIGDNLRKIKRNDQKWGV